VIKTLKAKTGNNKIVLEIARIHYIKSMTPHEDIMKGDELINPIEVRKHHYSLTPRKGVNGVAYAEKQYSVFRGSQRVQAALKLGYTHIEAIVINE
tara:strand:- start:148 stop:435 length:288 start_codon:yes stop_codon:yes gene_type:complete